MNKRESDIFKSKVSLVYEFNKSSPIFVRKAKIEIDENNLERGIEILNNGLKLFPNYPTGYFILGQALTLAGKYNDAKKAFEVGSSLINSKKTFEYYLLELENFRKHRPLFEFSKKNPFLSKDNSVGSKQEVKQKPAIKSSQPQKNNFNEDLLKQSKDNSYSGSSSLSSDEIDPFNTNLEDYSEDDMIVSETMAKIYMAQGEFREAIKVYEKLKKNDPAQAENYSKKIDEIKLKINN